MLTEQIVIAAITVKTLGHIEVLSCSYVFRDEELIATTNHRHTLTPGDSLENEDPRVIAIAQVAWGLSV